MSLSQNGSVSKTDELAAAVLRLGDRDRRDRERDLPVEEVSETATKPEPVSGGNGHEPILDDLFEVSETTPEPEAPPQPEPEDAKSATKAEIEDAKSALFRNPRTGKPDAFHLQARLISLFGPEAGVLLRELTFRTGLSTKLPDGWFYLSRDSIKTATGMGNRSQDRARAILRGDRPYGKRPAVCVLQERHPAPTAPTEYRVDLEALAGVLGVETPEKSP